MDVKKSAPTARRSGTTTKQIAGELRPLLGNRLRETPTTVQIAADDILEIAMERGGIPEPAVVPYEASAALSIIDGSASCAR